MMHKEMMDDGDCDNQNMSEKGFRIGFGKAVSENVKYALCKGKKDGVCKEIVQAAKEQYFVKEPDQVIYASGNEAVSI